MPKFCTNCGTKLISAFKYCGECGHEVAKGYEKSNYSGDYSLSSKEESEITEEIKKKQIDVNSSSSKPHERSSSVSDTQTSFKPSYNSRFVQSGRMKYLS